MTEMPPAEVFYIPTLRVMQDGQSRHRSEIFPPVAELMGLTQEQRHLTYETGGFAYETRIGFALSFLWNVGALDRPSPGIYAFTDAGRQMLEKFPVLATEKEILAWANEEESLISPYAPKGSGSEKVSNPAEDGSQVKVSRKFALAAQFRERVLESNRSFLWPDAENVWTADNALTALDAIKPLAGQGQKEADAQILEIVREKGRTFFQILCDVRAAYVLKTPLKNWIANSHLNIFADDREPFDGDEQAIEVLVDSASDLYPGSIWGGGGEPTINQMLIILAGLQSILADPDSIGDRDRMVDRLFNHSVKLENDGIMYFPFWSLMYLMYPQQFASAPAWSTRTQILKKLSHITKGREYPNYMAELADIRSQLEPDFDPYTFDFFANPWKSLWKNGVFPPPPPPPSGPTITDLAAATHLDPSFLREIEGLLTNKKQLIFEGPPGSGKTFVADKFARFFAGQPLDSDETNEQIELVQFHQSYSYEDFVEGIRPDTNEDGQLVYKTVPGIFREFAARAKLNPDKKFVLIIDEINRGNVSRILGELMLLLEYRDKSARLPYSKELLQIPENLYIIGTMNSADRSLSQIDYALRRRFYFVRFMSVENSVAQVLQSWLAVNEIDSTRILPLFIRLNALLEEHVGTDDLQVGHSYFMREGINLEVVQEQVWKYAVMPLLREYLYHHRERDTVLAKFELLRVGAPSVTIAEPSLDPGSERDTNADAYADGPIHE